MRRAAALPLRRAAVALAAGLPALALAACGTTTSSSFKGEQHEVAQAISNFQSDARNTDEQKICDDDISAALLARLNRASGGCRAAVKTQLTDVDSYEVTIHSVQLGGTQAQPRASASVTSVYSGKTRPSTLLLVKEGGKWRLAGAQ